MKKKIFLISFNIFLLVLFHRALNAQGTTYPYVDPKYNQGECKIINQDPNPIRGPNTTEIAPGDTYSYDQKFKLTINVHDGDRYCIQPKVLQDPSEDCLRSYNGIKEANEANNFTIEQITLLESGGVRYSRGTVTANLDFRTLQVFKIGNPNKPYCEIYFEVKNPANLPTSTPTNTPTPTITPTPTAGMFDDCYIKSTPNNIPDPYVTKKVNIAGNVIIHEKDLSYINLPIDIRWELDMVDHSNGTLKDSLYGSFSRQNYQYTDPKDPRYGQVYATNLSFSSSLNLFTDDNSLKYDRGLFDVIFYINDPRGKHKLRCSDPFQVRELYPTATPTIIPTPTQTDQQKNLKDLTKLCEENILKSDDYKDDPNSTPPIKNRIKKELNEVTPGSDSYKRIFENQQCSDCVQGIGDYKESGSGAWTAIGCLPTNLSQFFQKYVFTLAISFAGVIGFLLIVWGGFTVLISAGNPERVKHGQEIILSAIAGILFIAFSVLLLKIIGVDILHIPGFG